MSSEPNVTDLQNGVNELETAVDVLATFAEPLVQTDSAKTEHDQGAILTFCAQLQDPDGPASNLLKIQSHCNEMVRKLWAYPEYAREARYCSETSLQAADFGCMTQQAAGLIITSINELRDRAHKIRQNRWTKGSERRFREDHYRLDHIAGIYSSNPKVPNLGESIRPVREVTDVDLTLLRYLDHLERIPTHHRAVLSLSDDMAWDMVNKYYKDEPWYNRGTAQG